MAAVCNSIYSGQYELDELHADSARSPRIIGERYIDSQYFKIDRSKVLAQAA